MAEWKTDITQAVKDIAERALDEYQYKGHTIRQWADKITSGQYQEVKHGKWIFQGRRDKDGRNIYHCSECNFEVGVFPYNFISWRTHEKILRRLRRRNGRGGGRMNEKHIKILETLKAEAEKYSTQPQEVKDALAAAIEALKKGQELQVKIEVEEIEKGAGCWRYELCPVCGEDLSEIKTPPHLNIYYCPECGQAIKRVDEDES